MRPITLRGRSRYPLVLWAALMALLVAACSRGPAAQPPSVSADDPPAPDIAFTLETASGQGGLRYVGVGGDIDGVANPTLTVPAGATVEITLRNSDGMPHDVVAPDVGLASEQISGRGSTTVVRFRVEETGSFAYWCSVPGHRAAGMEGTIVVGEAEAQSTSASAPRISRDPTDIPEPVASRPPQTVRVALEAAEVVGQLDDGVTYTYWTFDGTVPGPFLRVRVGDVVAVRLRNRDDSQVAHSIDLHAVTGPGGGADLTQVPPGEERTFTFRALKPGLYVYHCATPMVAHHVANGMYGLILVEPEGGLAPVDREFYLMQGEVYTEGAHGQKGHQEFALDKLLREAPEYWVLNGAVGAVAGEGALRAEIGETVRVFYGVGGPNHVASFHVIGEILDRAYDQASLTSPPLTDVQTIMVPPGGATVAELALEVPGDYILVDHALSRVERGLKGVLTVTGEENPDVYRAGPTP